VDFRRQARVRLLAGMVRAADAFINALFGGALHLIAVEFAVEPAMVAAQASRNRLIGIPAVYAPDMLYQHCAERLAVRAAYVVLAQIAAVAAAAVHRLFPREGHAVRLFPDQNQPLGLLQAFQIGYPDAVLPGMKRMASAPAFSSLPFLLIL